MDRINLKLEELVNLNALKTAVRNKKQVPDTLLDDSLYSRSHRNANKTHVSNSVAAPTVKQLVQHTGTFKLDPRKHAVVKWEDKRNRSEAATEKIAFR